ncbi:MAG: 50S ribosomal protein L23, partial [Planctomycetes bacterium RBG_16_59_8]
MAAMQKRGTYTFLVDTKANKNEIKHAVEKVFSVKVDRVRTIMVKGKSKRMKNLVLEGRRKDV